MEVALTTKLLKSKDGTEIYAEAVGDSRKPALVLLHGVRLTAAVYDNLFRNEKLVSMFHLVRYDLRGHGRSGQPDAVEHYSSSANADDFMEVVKAFDLKNIILYGWSLGAVVAADLCELNPIPIKGVIYAAALPYIGDIMSQVGTPYSVSFFPGLFSTDDVTLSLRTRIAFIDALFANPLSVPENIKWAWLGMTVLQSPKILQHIFHRTQDPSKLFEAGERGLPLLILNGKLDAQINGDVIVERMEPHFSDMEIATIAGGAHALHFETEEQIVEEVLKFSKRILM